MKIQDLSKFRLPSGFRGRSAWQVQLWWMVQASLFRLSPQFAYRYRAFLLRAFGAKVGEGVIVRPSVTVTYPWHLTIGDFAWVGDHVVLYSLGRINIGAHAVVSQKSYLCAGDHDYSKAEFPIRARDITVGEQCWIAADTFLAPGVSIGTKSVVGARSSVFNDLPPGMICFGNPCRPVKPRVPYSA